MSEYLIQMACAKKQKGRKDNMILIMVDLKEVRPKD